MERLIPPASIPMKTLRVVEPQYEPRYTLAQLSTAARDYADHARSHWGADDVVDTELQLSLFIAWLAKREQGKE